MCGILLRYYNPPSRTDTKMRMKRAITISHTEIQWEHKRNGFGAAEEEDVEWIVPSYNPQIKSTWRMGWTLLRVLCALDGGQTIRQDGCMCRCELRLMKRSDAKRCHLITGSFLLLRLNCCTCDTINCNLIVLICEALDLIMNQGRHPEHPPRVSVCNKFWHGVLLIRTPFHPLSLCCRCLYLCVTPLPSHRMFNTLIICPLLFANEISCVSSELSCTENYSKSPWREDKKLNTTLLPRNNQAENWVVY